MASVFSFFTIMFLRESCRDEVDFVEKRNQRIKNYLESVHKNTSSESFFSLAFQ